MVSTSMQKSLKHSRPLKHFGCFLIFIPRNTIGAGIMVSRWTSVCLSVCQSYVRLSVRFSFSGDNLCKHQWIFTKLGICIDIVEIWFGIANRQISSNFDGSYLSETCPYFRFRMITRVNVNGFSPNLVCALILWRSGLGLLMGRVRQIWRSYLPETLPYFRFSDDNLSKCQENLTNLVHALIRRKSSLELHMGKFQQCLTELSARDTIMYHII